MSRQSPSQCCKPKSTPQTSKRCLRTISPRRTTFSPLTTKMPRGISPYFLPTWMRSTVWCNTKLAAERKKCTLLRFLMQEEVLSALARGAAVLKSKGYPHLAKPPPCLKASHSSKSSFIHHLHAAFSMTKVYRDPSCTILGAVHQ